MRSLEMRYEKLEAGIGCVFLSGRLDIPGVQDVELQFTVYTATQRKPVIVDLSQVTLITSIGLGLLISNAKTLRSEGMPFILANPQPTVEKVIRMAALDELLPIERDMLSALNRLKSDQTEGG